ncbi:Apoptosis-inducing factor 2 [Mortierella polycephala]|uniref:Apoptosis-inducing factor 2 n=1 Tax=Mortierella polycephala TaxID=41804 RepID=A0A9P6PU62_9FUNG|nr:Apoptosis-inducing factor 2 [Mortierella polycephala]
MSSSQPIQIVIVGGSWAGIAVINQLLSPFRWSKKTIQVTLIERNDSRHNTLGAFRALVDADYGDKIWIPYNNIFPKDAAHKVIQDSLAQVYHHHIVLESGSTVAFDYLVLCTGCNNPVPGKFSSFSSSAKAVELTTKIRQDLIKSKNVAVIGGGCSGVELAGEIKTTFPQKQVTLIHSTSTLIDYPEFTEAVKHLALSHLEELGVQIVLNERAVIEELDHDHPIHVGAKTIRTKSGKTIESDMQFLAAGVRTDTSYMSTLKPQGVDDFDPASLVDPETRVIKVQKTLQLADEAFPYIFAVGDCTDFSKIALATTSFATGQVAAKNILKLIDASASSSCSDIHAANKTVKLNQGWSRPEITVLTTGPRTGISNMPLFGTLFNNFFSRLVMSEDVMLRRIMRDMSITPIEAETIRLEMSEGSLKQ